jgi:hypothetical protein
MTLYLTDRGKKNHHRTVWYPVCDAHGCYSHSPSQADERPYTMVVETWSGSVHAHTRKLSVAMAIRRGVQGSSEDRQPCRCSKRGTGNRAGAATVQRAITGEVKEAAEGGHLFTRANIFNRRWALHRPVLQVWLFLPRSRLHGRRWGLHPTSQTLVGLQNSLITKNDD